MLSTTNDTYWDSINKNYKTYPKITSDKNCDVVIIGGGISGCLTCYYLSQYNINCILLEKNSIGSGNTRANSGLLKSTLNTNISKLISLIGKKKAARIYKLCQKSVDDIENILYNLNNQCNFEKRNMLYLCSNSKYKSTMIKDHEVLKNLSFDVKFMNQEEIEKKFPFTAPCAIYSKNCAQLDPLKFCHILLKRCLKKNAKIYENTGLLNFDYYTNNIKIKTNNNFYIKCKKIIFASGVSSYNLLKNNFSFNLHTSYSIVTSQIKNLEKWLSKSVVLEANYPYLFLRSTPDNRILIGGLDNNNQFNSIKTLDEKTLIIKENLKSMLPNVDDFNINFKWASTFVENDNNLPVIGKYYKYPNCYFNLNSGKNGILFSIIGAQIIKDLILYNNTPDEEIFFINN